MKPQSREKMAQKNFISALAIIPAVLLFALFTMMGCDDSDDGQVQASESDLQAFRDLTSGAGCAEISNRLFLIDKVYVFWDKRGNCADASYEFTLYGNKPQNVLCFSRDSIAGPQERCDENVQELFNTIVNNLDKADWGLGPEHEVEQL